MEMVRDDTGADADRQIQAVLRSGLLRGVPARRKDAAALARRLRHAPSLTRALWHICDAQVARGDAAITFSTASELLKLSEEHGLPQQRANALIFLGWALARSGEPTEGISLLERGLGALDQAGDRFYMTRSLSLMAESLLAAGRLSEGLDQVARGLDLAAQTGEQWYVPRLHCARADLLLHTHGPEDGSVEASLREALSIAQHQGARGWELPAATKLARFWHVRGRSGEARDLLAPVYGRFTEGVDTADLKEAEALLAALK